MRYLNVGRIGCGLATAALLAGCGSSGSSQTATGTGSAAPASSSAPATATTPPPSTAQLQGVLVQRNDLPAGWTSEAHQADPSDAADQAAFLTCVGGRDTSADQVTEQDSPDFSKPSGAGVSSTATSFRSQQDITDDIAVLNNPKASSCFEAQAQAVFSRGGLPPGATLGSPKITITPGSNGGPHNVAATGTGTIPLTVSGHPITLYLRVAFITGRLTESEVDMFSVGQPFPATLREQLTNAVATRTAAL